MVSKDKNQTPNPTLSCVDKLCKDECDSIFFNEIYYLGCASLNAPRSLTETLKVISILRSSHKDVNNDSSHNSPSNNQECHQQIKIILSVPCKADGIVRLLEPHESSIISSIKLQTILFCTHGNEELSDCFALTESFQSKMFQCHVFKCDKAEDVGKISSSFDRAFRRVSKSSSDKRAPAPSTGLQLLKRLSPSSNGTSNEPTRSEDNCVFCFAVSVEVKEDDGKGTFATVPWDKNCLCYKFRQNHIKRFNINVLQTSNHQLTIERCFGLLLGPGRDIKQNEMHLLDLDKPLDDVSISPGSPHSVSGIWDPSDPQFKLLNTETAKGCSVHFSVAVDLVIQEVQEPVRFLAEAQASVFPENEKFWNLGKKVLHENFFVRLKEVSSDSLVGRRYSVVSIEDESQHYKFFSRTASATSSQTDEDEEEDTDEPLMSGSGAVSMECSDKALAEWGKALKQWRLDKSRRPPLVRKLIRSATGVPEALRGEVWQRLCGCFDNATMMEEYRLLHAKDSSQESIIQRDIYRTYPAHDKFKDPGSTKQEELYKISKAYSLYDEEVGYSQGLSFLAAALLLHMPEEESFCVLVKIMFDYNMREMFKSGFEELHLSFYVLDRLMENLLPDLHKHFKQLNIETHMFSSQWFLTLFTAKFPLNMVYQVLDIFLCEGQLVVFQVAVALLECSRSDLLKLDFEGVLKYFRVQLPKKYRDDDEVKALCRAAVKVKLTGKKFARYRKDYLAKKEKMRVENPLELMKKKNKALMEQNMLLELASDKVAQDLSSCEVTLETQLGKTKNHSKDLQHELKKMVDELKFTKNKENDLVEENNRLQLEATQVKEMCRREMARQCDEIEGKAKIISDYKKICNQLSERLNVVEAQNKEEIELMKNAPKDETDRDVSDEAVSREINDRVEGLRRHARALELDLAQTKLKLVEAECKIQGLEHDLSAATKALQDSKSNTWFQKKFLSLSNVKKSDSSAASTQSTSTNPRPSSKSTSD